MDSIPTKCLELRCARKPAQTGLASFPALAAAGDAIFHNSRTGERHMFSERFMWAANWRDRLRQVVGELTFDGRGRPLEQAMYSAGTKLWALRQHRYSA